MSQAELVKVLKKSVQSGDGILITGGSQSKNMAMLDILMSYTDGVDIKIITSNPAAIKAKGKAGPILVKDAEWEYISYGKDDFSNDPHIVILDEIKNVGRDFVEIFINQQPMIATVVTDNPYDAVVLIDNIAGFDRYGASDFRAFFPQVFSKIIHVVNGSNEIAGFDVLSVDGEGEPDLDYFFSGVFLFPV